jgi:hypothetical protein
LSNSLKFAQSGHPAVTITSHERDSFQWAIQFSAKQVQT